MTSVPIRMNANKPRVPVRMNGTALEFLVDTGSISDLLDRDRARELGLESQGGDEAFGAGESAMTISTAHGVSLTVGDLELPPQEIAVAGIDEALRPFEERRLDGLLGYDFFARFAIELDYERRTMSIDRLPRGSSLDLRLVRRHPFVRLRLEVGGRTFEESFVVDTGFRSALVLASPFVRDAGILDAAGHRVEATTGAGIGGPTIETVTRASRVELGPFAFDNVVVSCSHATAGSLADGGYGGIVGSELLRRFTATFDYPRSRLSLDPNAAFSEPFEFDLAGLFMFVGDGIRVFSVVDGSPAAQAGIRPGDRIRTDRTLDDLRQAFRSEPGRSFTLEVERDGQTFTTTFELRRLV